MCACLSCGQGISPSSETLLVSLVAPAASALLVPVSKKSHVTNIVGNL